MSHHLTRTINTITAKLNERDTSQSLLQIRELQTIVTRNLRKTSDTHDRELHFEAASVASAAILHIAEDFSADSRKVYDRALANFHETREEVTEYEEAVKIALNSDEYNEAVLALGVSGAGLAFHSALTKVLDRARS